MTACKNSSYNFSKLCYGKRSVGGQKKRFTDTLKKTLISFNIDVS